MRLVSHTSPSIFTTVLAAMARVFLKKLLAVNPRVKSDILYHVLAELAERELAWDNDVLAVYRVGSHDLQMSATVAVKLGHYEKSFAAYC